MARQALQIEPYHLHHYMTNSKTQVLAVAIMFWLIEKLYEEYPDELEDADLQVMRVGRGRWGRGTYPTIWLEIDIDVIDMFRFEQKLARRCDEILFQTTQTDLMLALIEDGVDWTSVFRELPQFYDPD